MPGDTYLLATRSAGKLRELRALFEQHAIRVIDLVEAGVSPSPAEDDVEALETFEENARAKAEYFHRLTRLPTFADDSGLSVPALGGRPGVRSKRWSGRTDLEGYALDAANNAKLLSELAPVAAGGPVAAEYVCAAAFIDGTRSIVQLGRTTGTVIRTPSGVAGFGYDPYFLSNELGITFGEATAAAKNAISHRGRAFAALLAELRGYSTPGMLTV